MGANPSPIGGTWYCLHLDAEERIVQEAGGVITPAQAGMATISNNLTEMLAMVEALERLPLGWSGDVHSDSAVTLGRLFQRWKWTNIPAWLYRRAGDALVRLDLANVRHHLLDGHPTRQQLAAGIGKRGNPCSRWNCYADTRCTELAAAYRDLQREERTCQPVG